MHVLQTLHDGKYKVEVIFAISIKKRECLNARSDKYDAVTANRSAASRN